MSGAGISIGVIEKFLQDERIEFTYKGEQDIIVNGVSSISRYVKGTITWIGDNKVPIRHDLFYQLIVAPSEIDISNSNILYCAEPRDTFFHILTNLYFEQRQPQVSLQAIIPSSATIGHNTSIGDYCVIGENVVIGENCDIATSVVIEDGVVIGNDCSIKSGAKIGGRGFGYYHTPVGQRAKIPHLGSVIIGDRVDIGSNSCIDRGTLDDTIVCDDVKINNLCHVAHNCYIGKGTMITSGSIIYGSCNIGNEVYIASSIIRNHSSVGDRSIVGMGAVVTKNIPNDTVVVGNPARPLRK